MFGRLFRKLDRIYIGPVLGTICILFSSALYYQLDLAVTQAKLLDEMTLDKLMLYYTSLVVLVTLVGLCIHSAFFSQKSATRAIVI